MKKLHVQPSEAEDLDAVYGDFIQVNTRLFVLNGVRRQIKDLAKQRSTPENEAKLDDLRDRERRERGAAMDWTMRLLTALRNWKRKDIKNGSFEAALTIIGPDVVDICQMLDLPEHSWADIFS